MKILILSSFAFSLINFRGRLIAAMVQAGHEVIACAPDGDPEVERQLASMGVRYSRTRLERTGSNPLSDLRTLLGYVRIYHRERPDVVLAYTQKPIIYGGLAAKLFRKAHFYALMTGLGYVFSPAGDDRPLLRSLVSRLYRMALARAKATFVFNSDDRREMIAHGIVNESAAVIQVPGSGVDLEQFCAHPAPDGPPRFLMIARLMRDKGVIEYAEAARRLKRRYPTATFALLGRLDAENPTGITEADLDEWISARCIEYHPETRDVRPFLAASSVFVLPSYYREGLPRTLLEAMATGRALITTDLPGCREPVVEGRNGLLVPPRDVDALCDAMEQFLVDPSLAPAMGAASRYFAEERFDVRKVNAQLLRAMKLDIVNTQAVAPSSASSPAWSAS